MMYPGSGGSGILKADGGVARAAQARRQKRVQHQRSSPPSGGAPPPSPAEAAAAAAASQHQTPPPPPRRHPQNTDDVMNRSMEAGEEAASLLASVRKSVKGSTQKRPPVQQQPSAAAVASTKNRSIAAASVDLPGASQKQEPAHLAADPATSNNPRTTTNLASSSRSRPTTGATAVVMKHQHSPPPVATTQPAATAATTRQHTSSSSLRQSTAVSQDTSSLRPAPPPIPAEEMLRRQNIDADRGSININNAHQSHQSQSAPTGMLPSGTEASASAPTRSRQQQPQPPPPPPKSALKPSRYQQHQSQQRQSYNAAAAAPIRLPSEMTTRDAACVAGGAEIMVQSHFRPTRSMSISPSPTAPAQVGDDAPVVTTTTRFNGKLLGQPNEVLRITVVQKSSNYLSDDNDDDCLYFGDRVTLQHSQNQYFLGVRRKTNMDEQERYHYEVGFLAPTDSKSQQWILFHGASASDTAIKVGHAALEEDVSSGQQNHRHRAQQRRPVRSGDPVVFRNCLTGGILTLDDVDYNSCHYCLQLLTDAHRQPQVAAAADDEEEEVVNADQEPTPMLRLHRADRLVPSPRELFYLRPVILPRTPLWASVTVTAPEAGNGAWNSNSGSSNTGRRPYLDGTYLWYPDRHHDANDEEAGDDAIDKETAARLKSGQAEWNKQMTTPEGQERVLLDEFLGASMGLEGNFIKAVTDGSASSLRFHLFDDADGRVVHFDTILRRIVKELLPLPTAFAHVQRFVNLHTPGYEYGSVMQALCYTLQGLLEDHVAVVVSWQTLFQKGELTVRTLQVLATAAMRALQVLERACVVVRDKKGGALINALRQLQLETYGGDAAADRTLQTLLEAAARPYMEMLCYWLEAGSLADDTHHEFMVQRNGDTSDWEDLFEISTEHVLEGFFSTQQTVDRVLAAGRYWNALQQSQEKDGRKGVCGSASSSFSPALSYSSTIAAVSSYVQAKYDEASKSLVRLLMEDYNVLGALRLMKRYFLLEHGDFFMVFLDNSEDELLKDLNHLSRNRVQHWMNSCLELLDHRGFEGEALVLAAKSSSTARAPTGLRCRFSTDGLTEHLDKLHAASGGIDTHEPWTPARHAYSGARMTTGSSSKGPPLTGLDTFFLDFAVIPFPTSLLLSPKAIECYQLLFRHLFFAKHVERRLVSIWKDHQSMKELSALRGSMGPAFLLRQRMLHFVQNLIYYVMFEVIEPNWIEMESAIKSPKSNKGQTIDDIIEVHNVFLHRALESCLLTNRGLVRALTKLLKTCLLFSEQMKRFMKATRFDEDRNSVASASQKMVQNTLNDRGGARSSKVSAKLLHDSLKQAQTDRLKRVRRQSARVEREVSGESYQRMVTRFEEVFSGNLRDFMIQLTSSDDLYHTHKVNLCIRLDYNGYVTESLGLQ